MPAPALALPGGLVAGLLYVVVGVFVGATVVGFRVLGAKRKGRALRTMVRVGTVVLTGILVAGILRHGRLPTAESYEVLVLGAWFLAVLTWAVQRRLHDAMLGAIVAPTLALLSVFALLLYPEGGGGPRSAQSVGLLLHVLLAIAGCVAFTFAATMGGLYLWQIRLLKRDPAAALKRRGPSLETLDRVNYRAAVAGFPLLALSVVAGWVFIARHEGTLADWILDPTVLATVAGLIVYAALFLARGVLGWHGRRVAWLTVVGFLVVVVGSIVAALCTSDSVMHVS